MRFSTIAAIVALAMHGCSLSTEGDAPLDAGVDARDATMDSRADSRPLDTGVDGQVDAPFDAPRDAIEDAIDAADAMDSAMSDADPVDMGTPDSGPPECVSDEDCREGNLCTLDTCSAGVCSHGTAPCATAGQACDPVYGTCCPSGQRHCGPGGACSTDACCDDRHCSGGRLCTETVGIRSCECAFGFVDCGEEGCVRGLCTF